MCSAVFCTPRGASSATAFNRPSELRPKVLRRRGPRVPPTVIFPFRFSSCLLKAVCIATAESWHDRKLFVCKNSMRLGRTFRQFFFQDDSSTAENTPGRPSTY